MSAQKGGGYRRSTSGLVGAMVVLVGAVLAFVIVRGLVRGDQTVPQKPVPVGQVDTIAGQARTEGKLQAPVPEPLPSGWRYTSVSFRPGQNASWHLGMLTAKDRYVGIEERNASADTLAETYVDENATRGKEIQLAGKTWRTWTDSGGDYALTTTIGERTLLVGGSAPADQVRELIGTLALK